MKITSKESIEVLVHFTVDEVDLLKRGGDMILHDVNKFHDATSIRFKGI